MFLKALEFSKIQINKPANIANQAALELDTNKTNELKIARMNMKTACLFWLLFQDFIVIAREMGTKSAAIPPMMLGFTKRSSTILSAFIAGLISIHF